MSGRDYRPPRELDRGQFPEGVRHGGRGEPTGRDLPTERELNEAAERARRDRDLAPRTSWWKRLFAGRIFKR